MSAHVVIVYIKFIFKKIKIYNLIYLQKREYEREKTKKVVLYQRFYEKKKKFYFEKTNFTDVFLVLI